MHDALIGETLQLVRYGLLAPANMRTTCEQWMTAKPDSAPAGANTSGWCGQMVDWMNQHLGGWDNWMMNGPMMGNP